MDFIPPCLILSIIRYISMVKWSNWRKGLTPSPTRRCSSYWKGSFLIGLNNGCQLYFIYLHEDNNIASFFLAPWKSGLKNKANRFLAKKIKNIFWIFKELNYKFLILANGKFDNKFLFSWFEPHLLCENVCVMGDIFRSVFFPLTKTLIW